MYCGVPVRLPGCMNSGWLAGIVRPKSISFNDSRSTEQIKFRGQMSRWMYPAWCTACDGFGHLADDQPDLPACQRSAVRANQQMFRPLTSRSTPSARRVCRRRSGRIRRFPPRGGGESPKRFRPSEGFLQTGKTRLEQLRSSRGRAVSGRIDLVAFAAIAHHQKLRHRARAWKSRSISNRSCDVEPVGTQEGLDSLEQAH